MPSTHTSSTDAYESSQLSSAAMPPVGPPFHILSPMETRAPRAVELEESPTRRFDTSIVQRKRTSRSTTTPFAVPERDRQPTSGDRSLGWLWRARNLTTIADGCGLALVLHTLDSIFFPDSLPASIAGSTPHLFPPLSALLFCAFLAVLSQQQGRPGSNFQETVPAHFLVATLAFSTAWTAIEGILRLFGLSPETRQSFPLELTFTLMTALLCAMVFGRARERLLEGATQRDVLIVGTDLVARDVRDYLSSLPSSGYRFRGFISTAMRDERAEWIIDDVAGHVHDLVTAARAMFVEEVIVASQPSLALMEELIQQVRSHQITLRFVPTVSESLRKASQIEFIGTLPTIVICRRDHRGMSLIVKRALDLALGTFALFLLSPVLLAIAVAIKLQSDGPILYASERVGVLGKGFLCYKFRTMVRDAESQRSSVAHLNERSGILFKISKDPRVTPLGAWLRKYSLDELPQLFNVLRGEMSLVGPRPSLRSEVVRYETPHFRRLDVVPGMTGLWQVEARTDPSFDSYVTLDCQYADNWSVWLDLKILLRTFRTVFLGTGV
jgi:exopolysaccharide biosynthesis polyprenyl glycosylphosphotransferase